MAAEHAAERLAAVEANITDLRSQLNAFAADLEVTRRRSLELIGEKATEIEKNSELAHAKVHELYELANRTISALTGRVDTLEAKGGVRSTVQFKVTGAGEGDGPVQALQAGGLETLENRRRGLCRG